MSHLDQYKDKEKQLQKMNDFKKKNYKTVIFYLSKTKDAKIIKYFETAENKTEALRKLFK